MQYKSHDILPALVKKVGYESYLEIGVESGRSFHSVKTPIKVGVDPNEDSYATVFETSDDFFHTNTQKFDLFFVDGLHEADQVYRDINNCLKFANEGFTIVCHDMLPATENANSGDCWKAFVWLRHNRPDLEMFTINTDFGIGVIRAGSQKTIDISDYDCDYTEFENFVKHRQEWMNIISVEEFKRYLTVLISLIAIRNIHSSVVSACYRICKEIIVFIMIINIVKLIRCYKSF